MIEKNLYFNNYIIDFNYFFNINLNYNSLY